jgi:hypothetical protein
MVGALVATPAQRARPFRRRLLADTLAPHPPALPVVATAADSGALAPHRIARIVPPIPIRRD